MSVDLDAPPTIQINEIKHADSDDDVEMAIRGIQMLLNNKWAESAALFGKYQSQSSIMHFGSAFVAYLQATMSLEEEKIAQAKKALEEVEQKCDTRKSIIKRIKKKIKGDTSTEPKISQEDKWMSLIIVADSRLFQAVLTFINQDITSYIKGGLLLRRSWKIYEKVHADVQKHYEMSKKKGTVQVSATEVVLEGDDDMNGKVNGLPEPKSADNDQPIKAETMTRESLSRLLGAVSFGYGLFQLGLSLMPDKILKLIEFFGFEGNKEAGLKALEFSSECKDLRAPLSALTLLWYHTIMKPFFKSSSELSPEELRDSEAIIRKYQMTFPESSLFLFFEGRLARLQRNIDGALQHYEKAMLCANGQTELENAALFEIAWCNMMKLNYSVSYDGFTKLLESSRWSKCFYTYMQALLAGSLGRLDEATKTLKTVPDLQKKKTNQMEAFVSRRAQQFKKIKVTVDVCQLLVLELIYMWNNISQCSPEDIEKMMDVCAQVKEKKMFHLRSLVEGSLYKQQGDTDLSMQYFKEALARHEGLKYDYHIAAHALFEMGVVHLQSEESREEGRKMLLKAKDGFKEYDFENRLSVRIKHILKSI